MPGKLFSMPEFIQKSLAGAISPSVFEFFQTWLHGSWLNPIEKTTLIAVRQEK